MAIEILVDLIRKNAKPNMTVCEVGTFVGDTTKRYAPIVKENNGKIIAIDWFKGGANYHKPNELHRWQPENFIKLHDAFVNNLKSCGCWDIVILMAMSSIEAHKLILDNSLDICFIDANHGYSFVLQDIQNFWPKVKSGGILCGHDFEDISVANTFSPEELEQDMSRWRRHPDGYNKQYHAGVIQAVYDMFGTTIKSEPDLNGDGIPIWIKEKI